MVTENENVVEEKVEALPAEKPKASEADLAAEALAATEQPPEEPAVDPKDAVIGGFRRQLREAELRAARAEGALAAKTVAPPEKSPIELAAEEQGVSVDEVMIDGKLLRKHEAWKADQAGNQARQQATQDYQAGSEAALLAMTDENLGEGLGLESLAKVGEHLLTDQDHQEIFMAGKKCGTMFYKKLQERILEANEKGTEELCKRLKPQKSQLKPKKPQKKPDETKPELPSAEVILDAPSAHIGQIFDLD